MYMEGIEKTSNSEEPETTNRGVLICLFTVCDVGGLFASLHLQLDLVLGYVMILRYDSPSGFVIC